MEDNCTLEVTAVFPTCANPVLPYSTANLLVYQVSYFRFPSLPVCPSVYLSLFLRFYPTPRQTYLFNVLYFLFQPFCPSLSLSLCACLSHSLSLSLPLSGSSRLHGKPTCLMYYIIYSSLSACLSLSLIYIYI